MQMSDCAMMEDSELVVPASVRAGISTSGRISRLRLWLTMNMRPSGDAPDGLSTSHWGKLASVGSKGVSK